jgi:NAD(P)-dependent dehydrogenase (short-subunit alcohol dehydrogenase family)
MTKALPIKTALVTGATEGIGQATAWAMADAGHDVIVTDLETGSLAQTISGIEAKGRRALGLPLDLRQEASITTAFEKAAQMCGPIGLLVNNAGCTLNKPAIDVGWSEWDQVMDVNLKGSYFLTTRFAARCIECDDITLHHSLNF